MKSDFSSDGETLGIDGTSPNEKADEEAGWVFPNENDAKEGSGSVSAARAGFVLGPGGVTSVVTPRDTSSAAVGRSNMGVRGGIEGPEDEHDDLGEARGEVDVLRLHMTAVESDMGLRIYQLGRSYGSQTGDLLCHDCAGGRDALDRNSDIDKIRGVSDSG